MAQITRSQARRRRKERLKARAKKHGRSLEAEARAILENAAKDESPGAGRTRRRRALARSCTSGSRRVGLTKEEKRQFDKGIEEMWRSNPPRFVEFDE